MASSFLYCIERVALLGFMQLSMLKRGVHFQLVWRIVHFFWYGVRVVNVKLRDDAKLFF